jgi:dienelactone hydrolase
MTATPTVARSAAPLAHGAVRRGQRERLLPSLLALQGALLAAIVGWDGTLVWRAVRVGCVAALSMLAVRLASRLTDRGRGLLALPFGLAGAAIGLGIGVPHAIKSGLSPLAVIGVVSLFSGLALLVAAIALPTRGVRGWRRPLACLAAGAASVLALYPLVFAVAATNVPPASLSATTPADRGLVYLDVTYRTSDGVTISGWYVPSSNRAAVVLLHGAGSTRSSVLDHAVVLARHGYGVLLADARGHGRSNGRAMDFGWYGDRDLAAAVSYLASRPEVDPAKIGAVGLSMGGEEAVGAAALDRRIRAVVGEGVTNRTYADKGWLTEAHGFRGWLQQRLEWVLYSTTDLLTDAHPPIALRRAVGLAAPRRVLLITAGNVPDEAAAARWIQSASPGSVEVWVVPDTGHTGALHTHPEEWEAMVTAFLDQALAPAAGGTPTGDIGTSDPVPR